MENTMDRRTFLLGTLGAAALATTGCVTNKTTATTSAATTTSAAGGAKLDKIKGSADQWASLGCPGEG